MTRNLRTQLIDQAEHALRCWHGDDMTREQAAALLPMWRHVAGLDDDLRAEVLSRFPSAEPPRVPGLDWLPVVEADAKQIVEQVALEREPWAPLGACPKCGVGAGEQCVFVLKGHEGRPAPISHRGRPLVEVQPDAEAVA